MDGSLLFFYCFIGLFLLYWGFKFFHFGDRWNDIIIIFSMVATGYLSSFFLSAWALRWWISVITGTFILSALLSVIHSIIIKHINKKYLSKVMTDINFITMPDLIESLIDNQHKYPLYILHFSEENKIEIGINLYNLNPIIGKPFYTMTLIGRTVNLIPGPLLPSLDMTQDFICPLSTFYRMNEENRVAVFHYINAIKESSNPPKSNRARSPGL
ncbi:hypothetical protein FNI11_11975 [Salmonella enterica subsp. salamae]|nr:hypothetical protein [Salmonella enterica subsp. salamae]ECJ2280763.1 hypothetical protein [Salmonella enterica subsp. salamae]HCC0886659.1 hypothetical protein [Salmonella enterica]